MFRTLSFILASIFLVTGLFAQQPTAEPRPAASDTDLAARLEEAVRAHAGGKFWGGVSVARQGKVLFAKGYGDANDDKRAIDADSLFDIGSVTKQFTAAAILRLEMDGRLSTSDPVSKFFPKAGGLADTITLHHLLTHTAGISDMDGAIQPLNFQDRDQAVQKAMACKQRHPPGTHHEYCNGGYVVLGAVIEVVSGKEYEEYLRETLFRPAGMTSTGFLDGDELDHSRQVVRETTMLKRRKERLPLFSTPDGEPWAWGLRGAGGVLTTTGDLVKWDRALAADAILDKAAKAKLYRVEKAGYAYGWNVANTVDGGVMVEHGGGTRGFRCHYRRYLKQGVTITVWSHENSNPGTLAVALSRIVVPEAASAPMQATLHTQGLTFDTEGTGAALIKDPAIAVARIDEVARPRVSITLSSGDNVIAKVAMPTGWAVKLAADLEQFRPNPPDAPERGTCAILMRGRHAVGADGRFSLPPNLEWVAGPYNAYLPGGGSSGTDRVGLMLVDNTSRYTPLVIWLPPTAARKLAGDLREVAR